MQQSNTPHHRKRGTGNAVDKQPVDGSFVVGDGEMSRRIRAFDWAKTGLGHISHWPQSMQTAVNIVLQSPVPMVMLWGEDGLMIYNDAYSDFAGARHPFLLGTKVVDGWPEVADFNRNVIKQVLKGRTLSYEDQLLTLYRNNKPEKVWMNLNYSPILDEAGNPTAVLAVVIETTQRMLAEQRQKKAEEALRAEQARLRRMFSQAPAMIAVLRGKEHVFEIANSMYMELIGQDRSIIGKPVEKALPELHGQGFTKLLDKVYATGKPYVGNEVPAKVDRNGDGKLEETYTNFVYSPLINDKGAVEGIFVHAVDVTEQVITRRRVEDSERQYRNLVDSSPDAVAVHSKGKLTYINKAGASMIGADSPDEIIGLPLLQFVHPDFIPIVTERVKQLLTTGKATPLVHEKFIRLDGEVIDVEVVSIPFNYNNEQAIQVVVRDVTERMKAEQALRESEERFRFMAESMPQKIFIANAQGKAEYLNPQWTEYTGLSFEDIRTKGWAQFIHPDDIDENIRQWKHAVATGEPFQIEHRLRRHDGVYHWHLSRARAMKDSDGNIIKWLGANTDIDDLRKRKELEKRMDLLTKQRQQLVKINAAKDEFISLASHQLRTPATAVKQYIGMILGGYFGELTDKQREMLTQADLSNERQIRIINDLLKVALIDSDKAALTMSRTKLIPMFEEIVNGMHDTLAARKQRVRIITQRRDLAAVMDSERMRMAYDNLLDNASKYSPENTTIEVRLFKRDGQIKVAIKDEGVGLSLHDRSKLFRKFSRLDNPLSATVGGTGLGLYWVKKVIDMHKGTITVDSQPGKGSVFTVSLPDREA